MAYRLRSNSVRSFFAGVIGSIFFVSTAYNDKKHSGCTICADERAFFDQMRHSMLGGQIAHSDRARMPCPPDLTQIGQGAWTLLHSIAAYYPEQPTVQQQDAARNLMNAIGTLFPCQDCAQHLRMYIRQHPPDVESKNALARWMCVMHNKVNEHTGKPQFDCARLNERWMEGHDDCVQLENPLELFEEEIDADDGIENESDDTI